MREGCATERGRRNVEAGREHAVKVVPRVVPACSRGEIAIGVIGVGTCDDVLVGRNGAEAERGPDCIE
jgi:hypothetical protein